MNRRSKSRSRRIAHIVAFNCAIALASPVLMLWYNTNNTAERLWTGFWVSLVYSNFIGTLGYILMPRLWPWASGRGSVLKYPIVAAGLVLISVVGCIAGTAVLTAFGVFHTHAYWTNVQGVTRNATLLSFVFGGSVIFYETMKHRLEETNEALRLRETENERARQLATEAQLSSLESRIHPHFLFNALNSISSLIREDPERAERLIEKMASILRFSLDTNHNGFVSLGSELRIVLDYLEIERARFGERLRYTIDVPQHLHAAQVPPFAVQTLVENSVKYVVGARREGGNIRVAAEQEDRLCITVEDDGPGFDPGVLPEGHGLKLLQARLANVQGAALRFDSQPGRMKVIVELQS